MMVKKSPTTPALPTPAVSYILFLIQSFTFMRNNARYVYFIIMNCTHTLWVCRWWAGDGYY